MTEEQKEILIAKMLDAPSSLSDEELDMLMHDDELREIYEASAAVSSACVRQPELDMKAEWERFRPRIKRKPAPMRWVMRVAAIFLGVIFLSAITVRIIDKVFSTDQTHAVAKVQPSPKLNTSTAIPVDQPLTEIKDEAEKEPVIRRKPNHHRPVDKIDNSQSIAQAEDSVIIDVDIDEYLRIQQARIDNDLAMQSARIYQEEYENLAALLDAVGLHNPELDNLITRITPQ